MIWNYRVINYTNKDDNETYSYLEIHEVYYNEDGSLNYYLLEDPQIGGTNVEDIQETLEKLRKALDKPALTPEDFKFKKDEK